MAKRGKASGAGEASVPSEGRRPRVGGRSSLCAPRAGRVWLRLEIEKLRRALYGARSERKERLIDQLEMQLENAEADATEYELPAERSAPSTVLRTQAAGAKAVPRASAARRSATGGRRRRRSTASVFRRTSPRLRRHRPPRRPCPASIRPKPFQGTRRRLSG
jgi:Transposase C of IS166 homeodomain